MATSPRCPQVGARATCHRTHVRYDAIVRSAGALTTGSEMDSTVDGRPLDEGGHDGRMVCVPVGDRARAARVPGSTDAPRLAALLDDVAAIDALQARVVDGLGELIASGEVEAATGLPVETWLLVAGVTRSDRRMLATAVTQLGRLPAVAAAFAHGTLTWPQVRTVCLAVSRLSVADAQEADQVLAPLLAAQAQADPDELGQLVDDLVAALAPDEVTRDVEEAQRSSFVAFQPRLDGTGAQVYGDLDGVGFGLVAAALDAGMPLAGRGRDHIGQTADPVSRRQTARAAGAHRADRLVQLASDDLARRTGTPIDRNLPLAADAADGHTEAEGGAVDRTRSISPQVTLLLTVDQLLGDDRLPVEMLTTATGGRLKVSSGTARRWMDQAGGSLRGIVLDETGRALGVGRRQRFATGWVREAIEATHATCAAPGCTVAVRVCDVDHHDGWDDGTGGRRGRTDLDELGPLCRTCHGAKDRGWTIEVADDGRRRWVHPRTGITVHTTPRTVLDAPARRRRSRGTGRDPTGPPSRDGPRDDRPGRGPAGPSRRDRERPDRSSGDPPGGDAASGTDPPDPPEPLPF